MSEKPFPIGPRFCSGKLSPTALKAYRRASASAFTKAGPGSLDTLELRTSLPRERGVKAQGASSDGATEVSGWSYTYGTAASAKGDATSMAPAAATFTWRVNWT